MWPAGKADGPAWDEENEEVGTAIYVPSGVMFAYRLVAGAALIAYGVHNLFGRDARWFAASLHWAPLSPLVAGFGLLLLSWCSYLAAHHRVPGNFLARSAEAFHLTGSALAIGAPVVVHYSVLPLVLVLIDFALSSRVRLRFLHSWLPMLFTLPAAIWDITHYSYRPQDALESAVVSGITLFLLALSRVTDLAQNEASYLPII